MTIKDIKTSLLNYNTNIINYAKGKRHIFVLMSVRGN